MNADYTADIWQRLKAAIRQPVNPHRDTPLARQRWLSENALALLLQYMGLMMTTLSSPTAPVWFASGTACGFIFLRGASILPGLLLGTMMAFLGAKEPWWPSVAAALLFTLQAYALLVVHYRLQIVTLLFHYRQDSWRFLFVTAVLTGLTSWLLATCFQSTLWLSWWLANFNGTVIVGCALVTWDAYFTQMDTLRGKYGRVAIVYGLLTFCCLLGMLNKPTIALTGIVLLMTWIARTYRWCGVIAGLFLIASLASLSGMPFLSGLDFTLLTVLSLLAVL